ncbi:1,25-dihydroxyvitamin D(3) 24-hydroxylase, mitochondrial-like [Liolophura sinensis]|uniref:1,25-dihydroxyvitamin D(3) 24-hydroxylase, mitochondrial-like n=1 Tax=Liolophura sinensis TaxID=3198878 RepID=UPI0031597EC1
MRYKCLQKQHIYSQKALPIKGCISIKRLQLAETRSGGDIGQTDVTSLGQLPRYMFDDVLRKPTSIPQPFKLPLLGNVRDFIGSFGSAAHTFLQKRARQMGEIYQFQALGEKMVFLFNYKDVDAVRKAEGNCPEHIEFRHLKKYREERGLPLGVLISKGQEWRKQRRILAEPMLKPESVSKYFTGLHEVARDAVSHHVTRTRAGRRLDIERLTGKYALEASHHVDNQIERWKAEGYIPEDCILGMLYKSNRMSRDELHVNIADLLLAAIDTTSSAILWALHELSQHPQVEDEILREFDHKQGTQPLTYKDLHNLEYLRAVLKETLRLHPVAFFSSRITEHDVTIQGYDIPRKTHLACSMYVMGRDETLFPEPDRFKPDRWLGGRNLIGGFFTKVPFGSGVRMCLGRRIAETEILLFLLEMCKAYRIEAESKHSY